MKWLMMAGVLLLAGCINITAILQPENASVPEIRETSDCVPIIFGFAYGRASVDRALREQAELISDFTAPTQPLTKIRRIQLHDHQFLGFGARCVEVVGE